MHLTNQCGKSLFLITHWTCNKILILFLPPRSVVLDFLRCCFRLCCLWNWDWQYFFSVFARWFCWVSALVCVHQFTSEYWSIKSVMTSSENQSLSNSWKACKQNSLSDLKKFPRQVYINILWWDRMTEFENGFLLLVAMVCRKISSTSKVVIDLFKKINSERENLLERRGRCNFLWKQSTEGDWRDTSIPYRGTKYIQRLRNTRDCRV